MKIFAVDVGGTNLKLAVIDETGTISKRWNISSKSQDAPDKIIDSIIERFKEAGKIDACGISTAGIVKQPEGIVVESPNFPLWKNVHLKKTMESKTGSRVVVDNDANCALLAEYWKGNTAGCKNAVLLTLGTGIGGGCMSNSMLVRGRSGYGGEVGHIMIDPKGGLCGCGGKGHLETFCSSYGLRELSIKSGIKDLPDEVGKIPEFLYMNAVKGDKLSLKVWSHYGTYLGMGISGLI
ncbi:MAG: ROK family protein, partial [Planctomycetes bacterium]|nr:ROK family protein [Planctomycetota bacterium]